MALEAGDDCIEDFLTNGHLLGAVVPRALGRDKAHTGLEACSGDRCERHFEEAVILLTKPERSGPDTRECGRGGKKQHQNPLENIRT